MLEVRLQLAVTFYKCDYKLFAQYVLDNARVSCVNNFGLANEKSVWALISISLVYQRHEETWDEVSGWYEQAYSAVLLM